MPSSYSQGSTTNYRTPMKNNEEDEAIVVEVVERPKLKA